MPIRSSISDRGGFALRVKQCRARLGHTFAEVGEKAKVSGQCVWNWEHGNTSPRAETLRRLASALETSVAYLVEGKRSPSEELTSEENSPKPDRPLSEVIQLARVSVAAAAGLNVDQVRVVLDYGG